MLLRSTAVVGMMTLLSRILGLLRDILLAKYFGASGGTDAFFVAFKIPNFMRRLFAEGSFSQAFVPVFSEYKETRSREDMVDLVNHVAGTLGVLLLILSCIGMLAAPLMVMLFAPGFYDDPLRFQLTSDMLAITFPYIFFIALTAFAGGILNSYHLFAVPAITPVLLNLCMIAGAVFAADLFDTPIMALAWAVALAGLLQLLFQLPYLWKLGLLPRPKLKRHHEGVTKIMKLMLPSIVGSSVAQINLLLDTIIASFLIAGSVSWLYYSDRLVEFPLGVFGIALATVILPNLSKHHALKSAEEFRRTLDWALRLVTLFAIPASIGLLMLAGPMLSALFGYGEFDAQDIRMSSLSLMALCLGLPAFIYIKVLAPGFFARQDTTTPVRIGIIAMVLNMGFNLLYVLPMLYLGIPGPHAGLTLATTTSAYINAIMLYRGLRKQAVYTPGTGWKPLMLQTLTANIAMAVFLFSATPAMSSWHEAVLHQRLLWLFGLIAAACAVFLSVLFLTGFRPRQLRH
ncbi:MAG TPA: murein biosynthesis integral membrane protein MurJ [Gammaproteobacteria bacterium]|nr:murein biosynthesis integral membrane protein MurJ [Gammaproteobacteria bacterium]